MTGTSTSTPTTVASAAPDWKPKSAIAAATASSQFGMAEGELDAEMVVIAKAIIAQRTGSFDPTTYRDRYQEALQELSQTLRWRGESTANSSLKLGADSGRVMG
jgi:hypothetical protein